MFVIGWGLCGFMAQPLASAQSAEPGAAALKIELKEAIKPLADAVPNQPTDQSRRGAVPPSPEETMAAYRRVESWVREWNVPDAAHQERAESTRANVPLPGAAGACVTLRFGGALVGRGEAFAMPGDAPGACIESATRAALEAASQKMPVEKSDAIGPQGAAAKDGEPATLALKIRRLSSEIVISLELAGEVTPIEPATWDEAARSLAPGLDGVMARPAKSNSAAVMFPAQMLNANLAPFRALASVVARVIGEGGAAAALEEPAKIRAAHGVRMFRFRTTHLAQVRPGQPPMFLERGQRTVDWRRAMTRVEIEQFATLVAVHISQRLSEPSLRDEQLSSRAIAAYAISRYRARTSPADNRILTSKELAKVLSQTLADRQARGGATEDDVTAALLLGRLCAQVPGECEQAAWALNDDAARTMLAPQDPVVRSLRSFCMVGLSAGEASSPAGVAEVRKTCAGALAGAWQAQGEGARVALLPWFGWAAVDPVLARVQSGAPRYAVALRELRDQVWKHQLTAANAGRDEMDAIGGIRFAGVQGGSSGGGVLPSWQSARVLAFLATMLRDTSLTEARERTRELVRILAGVRFLRQLQVDESSAWLYADPARAMGGIRAGVGDSMMPLDASSMTLLFLTEALQSLDELSTIGPPKPVGESAGEGASSGEGDAEGSRPGATGEPATLEPKQSDR